MQVQIKHIRKARKGFVKEIDNKCKNACYYRLRRKADIFFYFQLFYELFILIVFLHIFLLRCSLAVKQLSHSCVQYSRQGLKDGNVGNAAPRFPLADRLVRNVQLFRQLRLFEPLLFSQLGDK